MRKPRPHQVEPAHAIRCKPCTAVFAAPRLGKTKIAIDGLRGYGGDQNRLPQTLILCPVSGQGVWQNELALEGIVNPVVTLSGCHDRKVALLSSAPDDAIVITSYETLRSLHNYASLYLSGFEAVVADESTKFKHASTGIARAMRQTLRRIPKRIILTGTPVADSLMDIWGQMLFLDGGNTFGTSFSDWRDEYFASDYKGYDYTPYPDTRERIFEAVRPVSVVIGEEVLESLPSSVQRIPLSMSEHPQMVYSDLAHEFRAEIEGAAWTSNYIVAVMEKLSQVCSGFITMPALPKRGITLEDADAVVLRVLRGKDFHPAATVAIDTEKIAWLEGFLGEAGDAKTVVWFRHREAMLQAQKKVRGAMMLTGGTPPKVRTRVLKDFAGASGRAVILAQIDAMKFCVSMAAARYVVYYEPTWSHEAYYQSHRRTFAGKDHSVQYYELCVKDSIEEVMWRAIQEKKSMHDAFMEALR